MAAGDPLSNVPPDEFVKARDALANQLARRRRQGGRPAHRRAAAPLRRPLDREPARRPCRSQVDQLIDSRSCVAARPSTCARRACWVESISWSTCERARPPSWFHDPEGGGGAPPPGDGAGRPPCRRRRAAGSRAHHAPSRTRRGTFRERVAGRHPASLHGPPRLSVSPMAGMFKRWRGRARRAHSERSRSGARGAARRELERAQCHGDETAGAQVDEGLHGLLGVHVLLLMNQAEVVGADGEQAASRSGKRAPICAKPSK